MCQDFGGLAPPYCGEPTKLFKRETEELESGAILSRQPEPTPQVSELTQIKGQLRYLQGQFNEHLDRSKKRGKYEQYTTT